MVNFEKKLGLGQTPPPPWAKIPTFTKNLFCMLPLPKVQQTYILPHIEPYLFFCWCFWVVLGRGIFIEQTPKAGGWQDARGDTENTEPRGERGVPSGDTGPLNPDRGHRGDRAENFKQLKTDSQERHRRQGTQVTRRTHGS